MRACGFVLAGGRSVRMGRDKASLPFRGVTLLEHLACIVEKALAGEGEVAIVGESGERSDIPYPVYRDRVTGCGPMGGVFTALSLTATDWNLIVACDMPNLTPEILRKLLDRAETSSANCVLACIEGGEPEPLCGVYHRRCLPAVQRAIRENRLKMRDLARELLADTVSAPAAALANANTPAEWEAFQGQPT